MPTRKEILQIGDREVSISNPDKVYFPKAGHTKLDLVRYFLAVADGALTGVRGRPMALKRFVDGAEKEPFFQKRAPDNTPDVDPDGDADVPVRPDGRRGRARRAAGLAWVANLGCLDLNPHPVRAEDLDHPDELRVDLDPVPGVPWSQVREVALVTREALEAVGLTGWPKTSGSRGIHINVRIEPRWTYGAGPPGRAGAGPRRRAAGPLDRDLEVVEGGAPRGVPRLQPEREGPDGRVRLLGPAHARRPRLVPAALGRGAGRRDGGLHARDGARRSTPSGATPGPGSTMPSARWRRCSSCRHATRPRARATRRGRRTTRSRRASRRGSSRPSKRKADSGVRRAAARTAGRRPRSPRRAPPPSRRAIPNAGLPTEWQGSTPSPTGRRKSNVPVIEIGRAPTKAEVYEGLERWKARHPEAAAYLEPADVLETAMRGRAYAWYRLRLNLIHVPEAIRPPQEELDPDAAPDDWANLSDDERAAWIAGRAPTRKRSATTKEPT